MRSGLQVAGAVAPGVAARLAAKAFFTPPRLAPRDEEREVLGQAEPFTVKVMGAAVRGWSWGQGPSVLLVHGWGGYGGQLARFVAPLTAAGLRAVALDLPGHGASGGKDSSLVHGARALLQTDHLFGPLHGLVAHSFGAACAGLAMAHGLKVPSAVFLAPSARFDTFWQRFREGLGVSELVWDLMVAGAERRLEMRFADVLPLTLAPRQEAELLVIHDRNDREISVEEGRELAASWPRARVHETQGLGHLRLLKDADVIARTVAALAPPRP